MNGPLSNIRLGTPRLVIREFVPGDLKGLQDYAGRPEVVRFLTWGPNRPAQTRGFLGNVAVRREMRPRNDFELAVTHREEGGLIGHCCLWHKDREQGEAEIGYCLNPRYRGLGLAEEAVRRLTRFGFTDLGLHRIWATCDPLNLPSKRLLKRVGFRREGFLKKHLLIHGRWRDSYLYAILKDEWRRGR